MVYRVFSDGLYRCPRWFTVLSQMVYLVVPDGFSCHLGWLTFFYLTVLSQAAYTVVSDGLSGCVSDDSQCCFK
jgi:hypothetical protein